MAEYLNRTLIYNSIRQGLAFLKSRQTPRGEIPVYYSDNRTMQKQKPDSSVFGTIQMIHALSFLSDLKAKWIRDQASKFVLSRMENPGIWRYWPDKSIAPDLDDTVCASTLLMDHHPLLLFRCNVPLILSNRDEQGLFKTWILEGDNDIDSVVNANVVWFLGNNKHTKTTVRWVEEVIRFGQEVGSYWYYEDPFALYYAVSRVIHSWMDTWQNLMPVIRDRIINRYQSGDCAISPLLNAQALCTLCNIGDATHPLATRIVHYLLSDQRKDGSWVACAAWNGPKAPAPRTVWWGSGEYTTGICIEAISHYLLANI